MIQWVCQAVCSNVQRAMLCGLLCMVVSGRETSNHRAIRAIRAMAGTEHRIRHASSPANPHGTPTVQPKGQPAEPTQPRLTMGPHVPSLPKPPDTCLLGITTHHCRLYCISIQTAAHSPTPFRLSPLTAPHYPAGHTPTTPHCSAALCRSVRQHLPPPVDLISAACTCKEPVVVSICDSTAARGRALEIKVQKRKTATRHHELCDHNRAADCSSWPNNFNACGCIPIRSPFNPSVKQLYAL